MQPHTAHLQVALPVDAVWRYARYNCSARERLWSLDSRGRLPRRNADIRVFVFSRDGGDKGGKGGVSSQEIARGHLLVR